MKSVLKTIILVFLIFALLIAGLAVFNKLNDKDGDADGTFGGFFEGIFDSINGTDEPYYVEGAKGPINFDFSEPGVLYESGVTKYEAKDGFLFFGGMNGSDADPSYVSFPLNKDGSAVKLSDYNFVEFSFDLIYDWNDEVYGDYTHRGDVMSWWRQTVAVFFFNINNDLQTDETPSFKTSVYVGCHQVDGIEGEDYDGVSVGFELYDDDPSSYVSGDLGYHFMSIKFRLVKNARDPDSFDLEIYLDNKILKTYDGYCSKVDNVYGMTFFHCYTVDNECSIAYDNFKAILN